MTDFNDVARQTAAEAAREEILTWENKAAHPLALAYVDSILAGDNTVPAGLAPFAASEVDKIFGDLGVPVREHPLVVVKARPTTSGKKGKRPHKKAA